MFEITTGMRAYDKRRKPAALVKAIVPHSKVIFNDKFIFQKDLIEQKKREDLIDRKVTYIDPVSLEIFNELFNIGKLCSAENSKDRPEMVIVLRELEKMNISSRAASVAASFVSIPMELQRAYDSRNRQRTISGDSSVVTHPINYK